MSVRRLPLKRLAEVRLGKMVQNEPSGPDDIEAPYLRAAHVQPYGRLIEPEAKSMWFTPDELATQALREGDVVVVEGGAGFGRSAYLTEDLPGYGFQNSIIRIRPDGSDGRFINYALQAALWSGEIGASVSTATIPHFTAEKVAAFRIPAPSLGMQRAVAEYLDRELGLLDAMAAEQQRQQVLLREHLARFIEQEVMALCGRELTEDVSLEGLPKLKHVAEDVTVGIVITPSRWYVDEGVPALRGTNIRPGVVSDADLVFLSQEGHEFNSKSALEEGDVVVVRTGNAGAAAVVPQWMVGGNIIDLLLIRPGAKLLPRYLERVLNSGLVQEQVRLESVGALQAHFNTGSLKNVRLPMPSAAEQSDFLTRTDALGDKIADLRGEIDVQIGLLAEHRTALVTAAINGDVEIGQAA